MTKKEDELQRKEEAAMAQAERDRTSDLAKAETRGVDYVPPASGEPGRNIPPVVNRPRVVASEPVPLDPALDPSRIPAEGDAVSYVPNVLKDNIGAGHCKATVIRNTPQGSQDLMVHGPNGDMELRCVDRGRDDLQGSWYWPPVEPPQPMDPQPDK